MTLQPLTTFKVCRRSFTIYAWDRKMAKPNISDLTDEEINALASECLAMLTLEERIGVVLDAFDIEGLKELDVWIDEEIEKAENPEGPEAA